MCSPPPPTPDPRKTGRPFKEEMKMRFLLIVVAAVSAFTAPAYAQTARQQRIVDRMLEADVNSDGAISHQELMDHRAEQFPRMDRNGDGFFNAEDIPSFVMNRTSGGNARLTDLVAQFDTDNDGRISRSEFLDGPSPFFEKLDSNSDGLLTAAERESAKSQASARWR